MDPRMFDGVGTFLAVSAAVGLTVALVIGFVLGRLI